jgi:hypothetical protein
MKELKKKKMNRRYISIKIFPLFLAILMACLTACGKKEEPTTAMPEKEYIGNTARNTVRLSSHGNVLEIAVEDYTGVTYNIEELKTYIQSEVDAYNKSVGVNKVSFREIRQEGDIVKTAISYSDLDAYTEFNRMAVTLSSYNAAEADRIAEEEAARFKAEEDTEAPPQISDAELAEAGYDPEQMDQSQMEQLTEAEKVTAVFYGPEGNQVASEKIDSSQNMMLVTTEAISVELEDGRLLYVNEHGKFSDNSIITDGEGTAVIVLFLGM